MVVIIGIWNSCGNYFEFEYELCFVMYLVIEVMLWVVEYFVNLEWVFIIVYKVLKLFKYMNCEDFIYCYMVVML